MKKTILSSLLAILMLIQILPVAVFADNSNTITNNGINTLPTIGANVYIFEQENKNGSKTTVLISDKGITEVTNCENGVGIIVNKQNGKDAEISVIVPIKTPAEKMAVEIPILMGFSSKTGWLKATYFDGKSEYISAKYDHNNFILSFELDKSAKIEIVNDFSSENPVKPETPSTDKEFDVYDKTNKNGSKTTVIKMGKDITEITNYDNGIQVVINKIDGKTPEISVTMSEKITDKMVVEIPVNLGTNTKTGWATITYFDGSKEIVKTKYDGSIQILGVEMAKSGKVEIIDSIIPDSPEVPETPVTPGNPANGQYIITEQENKNGSKTTIVVIENQITEITNYANGIQVVVRKVVNKDVEIEIVLPEKIKDKTIVEVPLNLGLYSRPGWLDVTYNDGKQDFIFAKYDNENLILSFEIAQSCKATIVGNFTPEKPTRPEPETPTVTEKPFPFTDVNEKDWFYNAVKYVYNNEIMIGVSDVKFAPNESITRAMIVTMLHRLEGKPLTKNEITFKDVESDTWYTEAIRWAADSGIINGYSKDEFGTNDAITREQIITIIYRYAQYKKIDVKLGDDAKKLAYADNDKISEWARPAVEWAYANDIIDGVNTYLMPNEYATRAMTASMVQIFNTEINVKTNK